MSWEVFVMIRKLCIVVLGIVELSGTIQVLCAILLLVISLVISINVRPYEKLWLNVLEEGSLFVLILTQTLSLVYLNVDAEVTTAEERSDPKHVFAEYLTTVLLVVLNIVAYVFRVLALVVRVRARTFFLFF